MKEYKTRLIRPMTVESQVLTSQETAQMCGNCLPLFSSEVPLERQKPGTATDYLCKDVRPHS